MILQVHDELIFEVNKKDLEQIIPMIKNNMECALKFNVPIIVDYSYGENWLEAH